MVNFQLEDTVVLITGAGTGLGLSIAKGLYACKAKISCISLDYETEYPVDCLTFKGDIFEESFVRGALDKIIRAYGKIDILINNIGFGTNELCENMQLEEYEKMFRLNLFSQKMMIEYVNEHTKSKIEKVINISSTFSKAAIPTLTGYASTKRGSLELTRQLANEYESISYACVCPGYFQHKKHIDYFKSDAGKRFLTTRLPLRRLGIPSKELVPAIITLCSSTMRKIKYIELFIDGGLSAYDGKE